VYKLKKYLSVQIRKNLAGINILNIELQNCVENSSYIRLHTHE